VRVASVLIVLPFMDLARSAWQAQRQRFRRSSPMVRGVLWRAARPRDGSTAAFATVSACAWSSTVHYARLARLCCVEQTPRRSRAALAQRQETIAKRDRLIWSLHREGQTQEAIGAASEVPQRTVADVIARLSGKRDAAKTAKPELRKEPPEAVPAETKADEDTPEPEGEKPMHAFWRSAPP
jgi:hypothetical protein